MKLTLTKAQANRQAKRWSLRTRFYTESTPKRNRILERIGYEFKPLKTSKKGLLYLDWPTTISDCASTILSYYGVKFTTKSIKPKKA